MLLAVDVGNTQTVLGLFEGERLEQHWRIATEAHRTGDELASLFCNLIDFESVSGLCLSSTVPALVHSYQELAERWLKRELIVLGPGTRTGIAIRFDDPREVGPDRIANAIAALERHGAPCIAVDFGTATNFDAISADGGVRRRRSGARDRDLDGGALCPRGAAASGGFRRAAERDRQEHHRRRSSRASSSVFAGQVDGIVERMRAELEGNGQGDRHRRARRIDRAALSHDRNG